MERTAAGADTLRTTARAGAALSQTETLPSVSEEERQRYLAWKNRSSARHPLYSTAASEVGKIPPGVKLELRPPAFGKGAEKFSDGFLGGPYRDTGLNTSVTRHRFLKELDGAA